MKIKSIILSALLIFSTTTVCAFETASLEVSISGARSKLGHVLILVFNDSEPKAFPDKVDKAVVKQTAQFIQLNCNINSKLFGNLIIG